ncbi:uncharacterized protein LACBIDRAFT_301243 [Laccaria bicolor S238N-H82]|uniref:Predicted protein n=1 Tax=Laccaria bicolor (strain S238N-H82 / ATCC MYA-4686) TaxID=486041 RepID=B0CRP9_LACBS|nr:uncharacterized protein LACBIDRAFT_301243 [Laccaria bicolor S238N-H82]EDR15862.1 predicted protein [Laccaria bicolor S238N-H82]|eukprot:XP_001874070.1 predicted protein [Laccaria bicolor S238N-H82]
MGDHIFSVRLILVIKHGLKMSPLRQRPVKRRQRLSPKYRKDGRAAGKSGWTKTPFAPSIPCQ